MPEDLDADSKVTVEVRVPYGADICEISQEGVSQRMHYEMSAGAREAHLEWLSVSGTLEDVAKRIGGSWSTTRRTSEFFKDDPTQTRFDGAYVGLLGVVGLLTTTAVALAPVIRELRASLEAFLKRRGSGSIDVQVGKVKVSIRGKQDPEEVEKLLKMAVSAALETIPTAVEEKALKKSRAVTKAQKSGPVKSKEDPE
jgi:hypothetical protein